MIRLLLSAKFLITEHSKIISYDFFIYRFSVPVIETEIYIASVLGFQLIMEALSLNSVVKLNHKSDKSEENITKSSCHGFSVVLYENVTNLKYPTNF